MSSCGSWPNPALRRDCAEARSPWLHIGVMKYTVVSVGVALATAACGSDHSLLNQRSAVWKSKADAELPPGRSVEEAKAWGTKSGIVFTHLDKQRQLYAIVERIPEGGLNKYVCSEWSIILKVNLTAIDTTAGSETSMVGKCL